MAEITTYLKNYQPPTFAVNTVDLAFELYDDYVLVTNQMTLQREHPGILHLHGDELELVKVELDGRLLTSNEYRFLESDLLLDHCPDYFTLVLVTRIYPQKNTKLSGLYRSNQLFCTQCEAEGFRRMTFFLDRPDVLAVYTTKITADKKRYPVLLSNGNLIDSGEMADGRHWVLWQDPFKKPCYLFALVAGELSYIEDEFLTCSGKAVVLRIYVETGNEDKCAHAMTSLKKSMRWDEEKYGREYDLNIFMIVAVSDFNMGAMENKGLNIFNCKYILARSDTATDQDFADIEGVVAHEYFHNWTGNRVTCRDWFQLSLKEGLTVFRDQEFSADMNSRDVNRIMDVKLLRASQFPEDASSMAHPVRPDSYQEINNFYTATVYNKGAEVIRMQHTLLGEKGFRQGMDLYFERHDGQAVTINDFIAAMEDANQVDLSQFKHWYSQAGTPEIKVETEFAGDCLTLSLSQSCSSTPEAKDKLPFHIPIRMALFTSQGQQLPLQQDLIELREPHQRFTFTGLTSKPVVSLLRSFSAPVKLHQVISQEELLTLLQFETDGYAKWEAAQQLALTCIKELLKQDSQDWLMSPILIEAYQHVLQDETTDLALKAELLTLPGFEEVAANLQQVDVTQIEAARDYFRSTLGRALFNPLLSVYQQLWAKEKHQLSALDFGQRKLRNVCLSLLMKADEQKALVLCQQQFALAKTMTDQVASFALLNNSTDTQIKENVRKQFYQQWASDELVMDKWFILQATSESVDTLEQVKILLKHPAFSMKNPNKVRSLIGAFCMNNPRNFHALDGSGYLFLEECVVALDQINPQVAARLAAPFTRWQRYDEARQALMQASLNRLAALSLSRDLKEVVSKSLVN